MSAAGPLHGIRVIDWTILQQGPVAGAMLGDLGAEVIKIEEPGAGDAGRSLSVMDGTVMWPYFENNNRNKKSITVNVKTPAGLDLVKRLVATADVFITNFRPGVPEKLGLGYEDLRAVNPGIVYGEASAFGSEGPDRSTRGHDLLGLARSGIVLAGGEPHYPAGAIGDQMGASMLAYGVVAALLARERLGGGQKVETSLLGGMVWLQGFQVAMHLMQGGPPRPATNRNARNPLYTWYRCADGKWLALATPDPDRHWPELIAVLGRPDLAEDPRFVDHASRLRHTEECTAVLGEIFATKPRDEWFRRLGAAGSVPFGPVNDLADVVVDPQVVANRYVTSFTHAERGELRTVGFPVTFSETPPAIHRPAPQLGEHTDEILITELGMHEEEVSRLRHEKVI